VHNGSVNEVDPASVDSMLKDSPWKEQIAEGLTSASASASEVMEDFGVENPLDIENIFYVTKNIGVLNLGEIVSIISTEGVHAKTEFASELSIGVSCQSNIVANNNFSSRKNANNTIDALI
jgi:hypothetical protein